MLSRCLVSNKTDGLKIIRHAHRRCDRQPASPCSILRFAVFLAVICTTAASLPVEKASEITHAAKATQHVITVSSSDAAFPEQGPDGIVAMRDRHGRAYACSLPDVASNASAQAEEAEETARLRPQELLQPLSGKCFYKMEEWWSYELCHNKHVKQFHSEGDKTVDEYSLGVFDEARTDLNDIKADAASGTGSSLPAYIAAYFTNGEKCDLMGGHRSAEVRYSCAAAGAPDQLVSVKEVSTCAYVLHVATRQLCQHPRLNTPPSQVSTITCRLQASHQQVQTAESSLQNSESEAADASEAQPAGDHAEGTTTGQQHAQADNGIQPENEYLSSSSAQMAHEELMRQLEAANLTEAFEAALEQEQPADDNDMDDEAGFY